MTLKNAMENYEKKFSSISQYLCNNCSSVQNLRTRKELIIDISRGVLFLEKLPDGSMQHPPSTSCLTFEASLRKHSKTASLFRGPLSILRCSNNSLCKCQSCLGPSRLPRPQLYLLQLGQILFGQVSNVTFTNLMKSCEFSQMFSVTLQPLCVPFS